jgi:hypothetical protein
MYASYASLLPHRCSNAYSFAEIFFNPHDSHPSVFAKASRFAISPSNRARTPASAVSRITNSFLASYGPVLAPAAARTTTAVRRPDAPRGESIIRIVVVIVVIVVVVVANIVRVSSRRTVRRGALRRWCSAPLDGEIGFQMCELRSRMRHKRARGHRVERCAARHR